jgi:ABC-type antimicrobial peptide transport system permease subunit
MFSTHPSTAFRPSRLAGLPYPVRDALRRWRTMLGMVAGVGLALGIGMVMLGVSSASVSAFTADFRRSKTDLYVVTEGGKLVAILPGDTPGTIKHARATLAQIRSLPGVTSAVGIMSWTMERTQEGPRLPNQTAELVATVGVDGHADSVDVSLKAGRWLRRTDEVVLGSRLAQEKSIEVGGSIRLNGRDFTVVGLGKLLGYGYSSDAVAYLDYRALRQRADVGDVLSFIAIDTTQPSAVRQRVLELGSYSAYTADDLVRQTEEVNATGVVIRWIFVLLTLAIAALFVSNMLARAVVERRLEFATLRAIGVPTRTIMATIGAQALGVTIAASVVGVGVSTFFGALINALVGPQYGIEEPLYVVDAALLGLVFGMALGLGLISGLVPARQATQVDPVIVLREA